MLDQPCEFSFNADRCFTPIWCGCRKLDDNQVDEPLRSVIRAFCEGLVSALNKCADVSIRDRAGVHLASTFCGSVRNVACHGHILDAVGPPKVIGVTLLCWIRCNLIASLADCAGTTPLAAASPTTRRDVDLDEVRRLGKKRREISAPEYLCHTAALPALHF